MEIFKVENEDLVINTKEIRGIYPYNEFLKLKRPFRTDRDGSLKSYNYAVLMYCYLVWDLKSFYYALPDNERHNHAIRDTQLGDKWEPDALEKKIITHYKETQFDIYPEAKLLITTRRALLLREKIFSLLIEASEIELEKVNNLFYENRRIEEWAPQTEKLLEFGQKITSANKNLSSELDNIEKLDKKLREVLGTNKNITGGGELNNREEPTLN